MSKVYVKIDFCLGIGLFEPLCVLPQKVPADLHATSTSVSGETQGIVALHVPGQKTCRKVAQCRGSLFYMPLQLPPPVCLDQGAV